MKVHFHYAIYKEDKNTEILPDNELIIERKPFKNNSSKYFINGRTSNYTEVTQRLREEGIDLDQKEILDFTEGELQILHR